MKWAALIEYIPDKAKIDWKQFSGTQIKWIGGLHPISETLIKIAPEFEELTGISVELETTSWDEMRNKALNDMENNTGVYDFIYGGGAEHFYRLNVTATPHISSPAAMRAAISLDSSR